MKITRRQLRRMIKEEVRKARSLNEYERADKLHETSEDYTQYKNLSPQKKQEWQKLEAALKPFGYQSAGVRSSNTWPFALFRFDHSPKDLSDLSTEELVQHLKADRSFPGSEFEIRIPNEWYEKETGKE